MRTSHVHQTDMEFHIPNEISALSCLCALVMFICCLLFWTKNISGNADGKRLPPEPAGSWPLIGHLLQLGGPEPLHKTLSKISDKSGPIFMVKLGVHRPVVVSNWKIAKECLCINDKVFVNRPKTVAIENFSYNSAMVVFAPYGAYWREIRRFVTVEFFSNRSLELSTDIVRVSEVRTAVRSIHDKWTKHKDASGKVMVDMKQWFSDINMNIIFRLIVGKSLRELSENERDRCQKAIGGFFKLAAVLVPADALPFLRWLDIGSHEKDIKRAAQELDDVIQCWLEEHKRDRSSGDVTIKKDFMNVMLEMLDRTNSDLSGYEHDTIIKATCLNLVLAGSDTPKVTLTWALSLLLNNRHVLKKAKDELHLHVGRERQVHESDMKSLVYLQAILKETMRLYPPGPLLPREAITDCCVIGYHIPAGTMLFVNVHKINRDSDVWPDPFEFRPERFLMSHNDVDVRRQDYELLSFGSGRRVCPGMSFTLKIMHFTLVSLLHSFDIGIQSDESVGLIEGVGVNIPKANPLDVGLTPRLADNLYSASDCA